MVYSVKNVDEPLCFQKESLFFNFHIDFPFSILSVVNIQEKSPISRVPTVALLPVTPAMNPHPSVSEMNEDDAHETELLKFHVHHRTFVHQFFHSSINLPHPPIPPFIHCVIVQQLNGWIGMRAIGMDLPVCYTRSISISADIRQAAPLNVRLAYSCVGVGCCCCSSQLEPRMWI
jgi:hypothetical protein